ncbi:MAG: hypothetical protein LBN00_03760 [Oscillospiraceae bacterium]|jgi:hypothetical protein|nr:hypothetical protein [Oscillospiraceae bacterium]
MRHYKGRKAESPLWGALVVLLALAIVFVLAWPNSDAARDRAAREAEPVVEVVEVVRYVEIDLAELSTEKLLNEVWDRLDRAGGVY